MNLAIAPIRLSAVIPASRFIAEYAAEARPTSAVAVVPRGEQPVAEPEHAGDHGVGHQRVAVAQQRRGVTCRTPMRLNARTGRRLVTALARR